MGTIGYLYKGPVSAPDEPAFLDYLLELLVSIARTNQLKAVIVQPPDESKLNGAFLARHHFLPNRIVDVISATLLVNLSFGMTDIVNRMRKSTVVQVKRARRRGVVIREGGETDIHTFFSLMKSTCERQRTTPVPSTEAALRAVWEAFRPQDGVRLSLADCEGEPVAGMWCIRFGQRITGWKKGWSGAYPERYPNQLVAFEAIEWACRTGGKLFDFSAMDRKIAVDMIRGVPLDENCEVSRDWFNLGFGNTAQLLPESRIYISNPIARFLYKGVVLAHGLARPHRADPLFEGRGTEFGSEHPVN